VRTYYFYLLSIMMICSIQELSSQCTKTVTVNFTSINFLPGNEFGDSGGPDPVLEVFDLSGTQMYISHYGGLSQVTGPQNDVPIDFNISWNPCFTQSTDFLLGTFPIEQDSVEVNAEVYEKDSAPFINPDCGGYFAPLDDSYKSGNFFFDLTTLSGTLDIEGLMSYNYELKIVYDGLIEIDVNDTLCPTDTLIIAGQPYHQGFSAEDKIVVGQPLSCDTLYKVDLDFYNPPVLKIDGPQIICPDESITLGVTTVYETYAWSNGETGDNIVVSTPGIYSILTTTSNGCLQTDSVEVFLSTLIKPEITGDFSFCAGDSTQLSVAANPHDILWSNGNSGTTIHAMDTDDYSVTLTDQYGCTLSDTISVTGNSLPTPLLVGITELCAGDTTELTTAGSYQAYNWTGNTTLETLEVTQGGTYSVTVTDNNGCSASTDKEINEITLAPPVIIGLEELCFGEIQSLIVQDSYTAYLWSDGGQGSSLDVATAGNYQVTVTDNFGCTATNDLKVEILGELNPEISGNLSICEGDVTTLTLTEQFVSYDWGGNGIGASIDVNTQGNFTVTVTDNNGCTASSSVAVTIISQSLTVIDSLTCDPGLIGIKEEILTSPSGCSDTIHYDIQLDISSNCDASFLITTENESCESGGDGSITVQITDGDLPVFVMLLDQNGILLINQEFDDVSEVVTVESLAAGNYTIQLTSATSHFQSLEYQIETEQFSYNIPSEYMITQGDSVLLIADVDTSMLETFEWKEGLIELCHSNCLEALVYPQETTSYNFIFVSANGACTYEEEVLVIVQEEEEEEE